METKVLTLINDEVNQLIGFEFDSNKLIEKEIPYYIEILCCDKVNGLSTIELIVSDSLVNRSIENVSIKFNDNFYKIDIKIRDINKDFSMPNLISIDKVRKYLTILSNHIIYIFIDYKIKKNIVTITNVIVKPIESLDWSYLSIQNLGKGQLQIKSMTNELFFNDNTTRKEWLDKLIKEGKDYYEKLILKVSEYKINWDDDTKWQ